MLVDFLDATLAQRFRSVDEAELHWGRAGGLAYAKFVNLLMSVRTLDELEHFSALSIHHGTDDENEYRIDLDTEWQMDFLSDGAERVTVRGVRRRD